MGFTPLSTITLVIFCCRPAFNEKEDPNAGLMKMMQNMYDDGDDDMKRTIAKAWTENRDKSPMM